MKKKIPKINIFAIQFIKLYQTLTKNKKHKCLHYPTCSNYGVIAYKKYSFIKATSKTINRIRDCHPFSNRKYIDKP